MSDPDPERVPAERSSDPDSAPAPEDGFPAQDPALQPDRAGWNEPLISEEEAVERVFTGIRKLRQGEMTRRESRMTWTLCAIYSLGILGLYLVLPVLSPYAHTLRGQTSLLVGMSIGAYGLTQTIFQIPFGNLSDRIGRKSAILIGLLFFATGGIVAALARTVEVLILGRLLQGAGAVASAVVSLVADLTRPGVRTQAMARLGLAIGGSFAIGMVAGPLIAHHLGVRVLFVATSCFSVAAAALLFLTIPSSKRSRVRADERMQMTDLPGILRQRRVLLLYGGTFILHTIVTVLFVVVPFDLSQGSSLIALWKVALPAVAVGLVAMALTARASDRRRRPELVLLFGSFFLCASCAIMAGSGNKLPGVLGAVLVFVLAVALLEPALPSMMTRFAVGRYRGTAMGFFHMSQFLGTFTGGLLGGAFLRADRAPLFVGFTACIAIWAAAVLQTRGWRPAVESQPQENPSA